MAKHIYTFVEPTNEKHLNLACKVLDNHGLIAYPTDVNWAVGCDSRSSKALDKMRKLRPSHPKDQPFSLICSSISMVAEIAVIDHSIYRLLKRLWPGPYTCLLKRSRLLPRHIREKRPLLGVRVPQSHLILDLVKTFNRPILTSSLSVPSSYTKGEQKILKFGYEIDEKYGYALDLILDLGEEVFPEVTTIVDLSDGTPHLVREGIGKVIF